MTSTYGLRGNPNYAFTGGRRDRNIDSNTNSSCSSRTIIIDIAPAPTSFFSCVKCGKYGDSGSGHVIESAKTAIALLFTDKHSNVYASSIDWYGVDETTWPCARHRNDGPTVLIGRLSYQIKRTRRTRQGAERQSLVDSMRYG